MGVNSGSQKTLIIKGQFLCFNSKKGAVIQENNLDPVVQSTGSLTKSLAADSLGLTALTKSIVVIFLHFCKNKIE